MKTKASTRMVAILAAAWVCSAIVTSLLGRADAPAQPAPSTQTPSSAPTAAAAVKPMAAYPADVNLSTARARQSIVVQQTRPDGVTTDATGLATFAVADPKVCKVEGHVVLPVGDGKTEIRVNVGDQSQVIPVTVTAATADRPISFKLDVMPVFMRAGCNVGGCHGAARGKDGFRISLFGFDPDGDYFRLTREMSTRRLNLAIPEESLLLTKATGAVPHTGGKRFEPGSEMYQTIVRWLDAGAPKDSEGVAKPVALELMPSRIVLEGEGAKQQLVARAKYSDGSERDVTNLVVFLTNNENSAPITSDGLITAKARGEAFVMARFATFTVGSQVLVIPKDLKYQWPAVPENNYVDALIDAKLRKLRLVPSPLCNDEVFLRRAYIDVIGTLPTPAEYAAFMQSSDPKKREKLIDDLLGRKEFVEMWVMKWAELLQIRSSIETNLSYKAALRYYEWLQDQIARNVPFDQVVRELIASSGGTFKNPATNYYEITKDPLKLAENCAQVFMGMRIQCAQCHNHPFDRWTMDDYYSFAGFFAQVGRKQADDPRETVVFNGGGGDVRHPIGNRVVPPKFLGAEAPDIKGRDRRQVLAEWLASPRNPYFATNLANMVWGHFFGRGIIDPVDDVRISNPAVNPELLEALGQRFTSYHYDFKRLVRDICTSRTYQLASESVAGNETDETNFSHASLRRMRAEVLLDAICQVTQTREKFKGLPLGARAVQIADGTTTNYFLTTFGRATRETVCSCEVSLQPNLSQALALINGDVTQGRIARGGVIQRMVAENKSPNEILGELYLRTLSRPPTDNERQKLLALVDQSGTDPKAKTKALEDVFWALLNSPEFMFNH